MPKKSSSGTHAATGRRKSGDQPATLARSTPIRRARKRFNFGRISATIVARAEHRRPHPRECAVQRSGHGFFRGDQHHASIRTLDARVSHELRATVRRPPSRRNEAGRAEVARLLCEHGHRNEREQTNPVAMHGGFDHGQILRPPRHPSVKGCGAPSFGDTFNE